MNADVLALKKNSKRFNFKPFKINIPVKRKSFFEFSVEI